MDIYKKDLIYSGVSILINAILNTGVLNTSTSDNFVSSENTHSIRVRFSGQDITVPDILERDLGKRFADIEQEAKDYIDGVNNSALNALLLSAGFVKLPEIDKPASFVAYPYSYGPRTQVGFTFDLSANATGYQVQISQSANFETIEATADLDSIHNNAFFASQTPATKYYLRARALGDGENYADSDYAYSEATTAP